MTTVTLGESSAADVTPEREDGLDRCQTLELIATDRGSLSDIPAWSKDLGHAIKEQFEQDGEFHFVVEKA